MHRNFDIHIIYSKIFQVKEYILTIINGNYKNIYKILSKYYQRIIEFNLDIIIIFNINNNHKFHRLFICFEVNI